jgi:hypothetical protein
MSTSDWAIGIRETRATACALAPRAAGDESSALTTSLATRFIGQRPCIVPSCAIGFVLIS